METKYHLTKSLKNKIMEQLDILINQRAYLMQELELFQHPALTLIFALITIMAIVWIFYKYWHRYCYTLTGNSILFLTLISITIILYIYIDDRIERRNLLQELALVEEKLIIEYDYDL